MSYHVFLSYAHVDKPRVEPIAFRLANYGLRVWFDKWCILKGDDFHAKINEGLEQSTVTIVVYSKASTDSKWVKSETAAAFNAAVKRSSQKGKRLIPLKLEECQIPPLEGTLDMVDLSQIAEDDADAWERRIFQLLHVLNPDLVKLREGYLALPLVVASMTREEAADLFTGKAFDGLPAYWKESFDLFLQQLAKSIGLAPGADVETAVLSRYDERREDWKPFSSALVTIRDLLEELVQGINEARRQQLQKAEPDIALELHSYSLFAKQSEIRDETAYRLAQRGCLLVMDPLALYHPRIVGILSSSQLLLNPAVTILCTSPLDLSASGAATAVAGQFGARLGLLYKRFKELEPQCVMGVGDPESLGLWLKVQLPIATSRLIKSAPIKKTLSDFLKSAGVAVHGIEAAILETIPS